MRVPIVEYPQIVRQNLPNFRQVFANRNQVKHFCEYVTGLIAGDKGTIQAINDLFLNKNDQSALNKFLTRASWDEMDLNYRRVRYELERLHRRPISAKAGRLILDDTLAHHTKCSIEGLAYLRDHMIGRNVWADNVITSDYVNRSDQFPVDFRVYLQFNRKHEDAQLQQQAEGDINAYRQYLATLLSYHYRQQAYRPKAALAAELVQQAVEWQLPFGVVLFDSWFLRWTLIAALEQLLARRWIPKADQHRVAATRLPQRLDRARVDDSAAVQDLNAVTHGLHFGQNVRGQDDAVVALELADQAADLADLVRIEADGGLIEDDYIRAMDDGLGDTDPLLIAFGQRGDHAPPHIDQATALLCTHDGLGELPVRNPMQACCETEEFVHPQFSIQGRDLGKITDAGFRRRWMLQQVDAADADAARTRCQIAREHLHGRGLAGAVGTQQPEHLAAPQLQIEAAHGRCTAEAARQLAGRQG